MHAESLEKPEVALCFKLTEYFTGVLSKENFDKVQMLLKNLSIKFGSENPSILQPSQKLAFYKAQIYDNTQLQSILDAIVAIAILQNENGSAGALDVLYEIHKLLNKSRSKNWSAGSSFSGVQFTDPSLNNLLITGLLEVAGYNEPQTSAVLAMRGVEFTELLGNKIVELKIVSVPSTPEPSQQQPQQPQVDYTSPYFW